MSVKLESSLNVLVTSSQCFVWEHASLNPVASGCSLCNICVHAGEGTDGLRSWAATESISSLCYNTKGQIQRKGERKGIWPRCSDSWTCRNVAVERRNKGNIEKILFICMYFFMYSKNSCYWNKLYSAYRHMSHMCIQNTILSVVFFLYKAI